MTETKLREVERLIEKLYTETFHEVSFGPVFARADLDEYGDEYLRIHVIYDSPDKLLDPRKTIGLKVPIKRELEEKLQVTALAVISHVDRAEEPVWTPDVFRCHPDDL